MIMNSNNRAVKVNKDRICGNGFYVQIFCQLLNELQWLKEEMYKVFARMRWFLNPKTAWEIYCNCNVTVEVLRGGQYFVTWK